MVSSHIVDAERTADDGSLQGLVRPSTWQMTRYGIEPTVPKASISRARRNQPTRPSRKASQTAGTNAASVMAPLLIWIRRGNGGRPSHPWISGTQTTTRTRRPTDTQNCLVRCGVGKGPSHVDAVIGLTRKSLRHRRRRRALASVFCFLLSNFTFCNFLVGQRLVRSTPCKAPS